jgi:4-hydroxybenzoate polyprenyltransferase
MHRPSLAVALLVLLSVRPSINNPINQHIVFLNDRAPRMKTIDEQKNGVFWSFFTGFIRIRGVGNWFAISFFGFLLAIPSLDITNFIIPLVFFVISTFFILAFTFAINNYYDIDTDKENPRRINLNALASGKLSKKTGMMFNLIFIIIPLTLSLFYSPMVFVFCGFLVFWMWAYSAPPLRLKGRPGVDLLWHFIAFFALVLWGAFLAGDLSTLTFFVAISFGLFGCFAQIDNHIHDYAFDKASGAQTFAVWIGMHHATIALKISFIVYLVTLVPLIILFSLSSSLTFLIICGGFLISILLLKIKRSSGTSLMYDIINYFGRTVYFTCLIYHITSIL